MVTEFDIIRDYFFPLGPQNFPVSHPHWQLIVGNGDDCAVIQTECPLVFSIDTQVDQVHFLNSMHPSHIAYRGLAAALSDLAAMGAEPVFYTLALTLTGQESAAWIQDYVSGLHTLSSQLNCPLVGGDTTQGSCLVQTFQVHGVIPEGAPITRQGARPGDKVWVTGTLGDAAAGAWELGAPAWSTAEPPVVPPRDTAVGLSVAAFWVAFGMAAVRKLLPQRLSASAVRSDCRVWVEAAPAARRTPAAAS